MRSSECPGRRIGLRTSQNERACSEADMHFIANRISPAAVHGAVECQLEGTCFARAFYDRM
jgi:hypothetical protein